MSTRAVNLRFHPVQGFVLRLHDNERIGPSVARSMPQHGVEKRLTQDLVHLLRTRRFMPLFMAQFLGAFNDNLFKNALAILITFRASEGMREAPILLALAVGIFILPYFIFSATAGQLADREEKSSLIRKIKMIEIAIMALGAIGFLVDNVYLLMFVLFLTGTQAAFFGPLKYGILPDHLAEEELIAGNALIEGATFIAILAGTITGGLLILASGGAYLIAFLVLAVSGLGYLASRHIPPTSKAAPDLEINPNIWAETKAMMSLAAERRDVFTAILGIAWFWFVGATFLAQFPSYAKIVIGGDEQVVTLFLTAFSIGIAVGSLLCHRLLKGVITARYVPLAGLAMTVFIVDLYATMQNPATPPTVMMGAFAFLQNWTNLHVLADLTLIAVAGGIYIVPLYAMVQDRSPPAHRARTIASLNIMDSGFMVASSAVTILLFYLGASVREVFLLVGLANIVVALYLRRLDGL